MDRRPWRTLLLAACLLLGVSTVTDPAAAHPLHLMIANLTPGNPERVDSGNWIAQSIVPPVGFVVTRVSLYVEDVTSSDILAVQIRDDVAGVPGPALLASGTVDGPPNPPGWLDVDVTPNAVLAAGQTYWIVASSASNSGYDWWNTVDDSAYLPGTAATSSNGVNWSPAAKDFTFQVYGFTQPSFAFSASPGSPTADTGQIVTFRANFTNAGPGTSAGVWVNVTLPQELSYVGDDAASIGGVRTGTNEFAFADVAPGTYSFNLTARVASGVANGTILSALFAFAGADHNGLLLSSADLSVLVTVRSAPGGGAGAWWWLLALAVALVLPAVFVVWTRGKLEEVFLVGYSGILLAHLSNTMKAERDRDLLTGMLTAVQEFIRDSFVTSDEGELRRLDFGDRTIHICRGGHSYLAAVVRGRSPLGLSRKMEETLWKLERAFPESMVLKKVDGKVLDGAGELLSKELLRR